MNQVNIPPWAIELGMAAVFAEVRDTAGVLRFFEASAPGRVRSGFICRAPWIRCSGPAFLKNAALR